MLVHRDEQAVAQTGGATVISAKHVKMPRITVLECSHGHSQNDSVGEILPKGRSLRLSMVSAA